MDRFQEMAAFLAVADERNFSAAARRLKVSPPTATRAVAALEKRIGARLLARTTRSVRLTQAGERYLEDCRRILAELAEVEESAAVARMVPRGQLVVSAPVLFGETVVTPLLIDYMDAWPALTIRALLLDRLTSMIDEGIDVAVRIGAAPDVALHAIPVGTVRHVVCATPAFLQRHGVPTHPEQLVTYPVAGFTNVARSTEWQFEQAGRKFAVSIEPHFGVNSNHAAMIGVLRGWGLTRAFSYQIASQLASGALVVVLADYEPAPLTVEVVCRSARLRSPKIRNFMDFCVAGLRDHCALRA